MTSLSWDDDGAQEGLLTKRLASTCLSEREIDDFLFNRLSGVTREVIEEHLLVCHNCLDRVEEEEANKLLIRDAAGRLVESELSDPKSPDGPQSGDRWKDDGPSWFDILKTWLGRRSVSGISYALAALLMTALLASVVLLVMRPAPPVEVALWVERGEVSSMAQAPANAPLRLTMEISSLPKLPAYRLEVVDARGKALSSVDLTAAEAPLVLSLPSGLEAGQYWIRMRDPAQPGELLREFGLTVKASPRL
jgi:hypothetical protein